MGRRRRWSLSRWVPVAIGAAWTGLSPGVYEVHAVQHDGTGGERTAWTGLTVPSPDEIGHIAPDHRALRRAAALTGGATIESSGDLAALALQGDRPAQLGWAQLLTIALLAFVADIGVRRLVGRPREIRDRIGERVRSLRAAPGALRRLHWPISRTA